MYILGSRFWLLNLKPSAGTFALPSSPFFKELNPVPLVGCTAAARSPCSPSWKSSLTLLKGGGWKNKTILQPAWQYLSVACVPAPVPAVLLPLMGAAPSLSTGANLYASLDLVNKWSTLHLRKKISVSTPWWSGRCYSGGTHSCASLTFSFKHSEKLASSLNLAVERTHSVIVQLSAKLSSAQGSYLQDD